MWKKYTTIFWTEFSNFAERQKKRKKSYYDIVAFIKNQRCRRHQKGLLPVGQQTTRPRTKFRELFSSFLPSFVVFPLVNWLKVPRNQQLQLSRMSVWHHDVIMRYLTVETGESAARTWLFEQACYSCIHRFFRVSSVTKVERIAVEHSRTSRRLCGSIDYALSFLFWWSGRAERRGQTGRCVGLLWNFSENSEKIRGDFRGNDHLVITEEWSFLDFGSRKSLFNVFKCGDGRWKRHGDFLIISVFFFFFLRIFFYFFFWFFLRLFFGFFDSFCDRDGFFGCGLFCLCFDLQGLV